MNLAVAWVSGRCQVTSCCQQKQANSGSYVQSTLTRRLHSAANVAEPTHV
jgi:hypothetical protein